jgi:hypothetical protein
MRRLRPLTEAECYARCYGGAGDDVRVVRIEARPSRVVVRLSGEELRRRFEERLDGREPEVEAA